MLCGPNWCCCAGRERVILFSGVSTPEDCPNNALIIKQQCVNFVYHQQIIMKSIFDKVTRDELTSRINNLNENSTAQWGKMDAGQMLEHCIRAEEHYRGKRVYKRVPLSYIFGKVALKNILKDGTPLQHNMPTKPEFVVTGASNDITGSKEKWIALINSYEQYAEPRYVHFFFGPMTKEQLGHMVYKHADHHLRQFNS